MSTMSALMVGGILGFDAVSTSTNDADQHSKVPAVTTVDQQDPQALRVQLAARLAEEGVITDAGIRSAFETVARHRFLPGFTPAQAYVDDAVYTKIAGDGTRISAASQPRIVATMLRQLAAEPGHHIFEAGAGTGYNAALMGTIVGPDGTVVTVDVDEDLVDTARANLATAGPGNVTVILGDGAAGYPAAAPYNRLIATVGAHEIPTAWLEQAAPDARLAVPLRLRGAVSRSIAFVRGDGGWVSAGSELAVFMPLRGSHDDARRIVALTPDRDGDNAVTLQVNKDQTVNPELLAGILGTDRHTVWTEVKFPPMVPYEWVELWLALSLPGSILRMNTGKAAVESGVVAPMHPQWGAMATVDGPNLAYLALRPAEPVDGKKRYEIGVTGHGPAGQALADQVAAEIRDWDTRFRGRPVRFEIEDHPAPADPENGRFVLDRQNNPITVVWE
jgi:protein-L-isoaspartate(D-aspartate) O-methyltransferase